MIKFENTEVVGWEAAIRGMRNPMNSWEKSDSEKCLYNKNVVCAWCEHGGLCNGTDGDLEKFVIIGPNDHDLMMRLRNAGTDHRKFMRMITVYTDIIAPLYWWKEFDTYRVGVEKNSCSTMHKIHEKEFTLEDFSCEHLFAEDDIDGMYYSTTAEEEFTASDVLKVIIEALNNYRVKYLETKVKPMKDESKRAELMKKYWWQMIQLLPSSYNQKRTVMLNYEVLANIYKSRKNHKLDEWSVGFMEWIESLPYSEFIIQKGEEK